MTKTTKNDKNDNKKYSIFLFFYMTLNDKHGIKTELFIAESFIGEQLTVTQYTAGCYTLQCAVILRTRAGDSLRFHYNSTTARTTVQQLLLVIAIFSLFA